MTEKYNAVYAGPHGFQAVDDSLEYGQGFAAKHPVIHPYSDPDAYAKACADKEADAHPELEG